MRIVVSGGGTGGHIYPALALINQLKARHLADAVLYVGTEAGLESRIVPANGIDFATIKVQGFKRSLTLENFKTITEFIKSVGDAKRLLKEFKPDVVIGTGGYVSGATVYAASRLRIPTVIHEQNSVAGVTNKFLSHFVTKIAIAFPEVASTFPAKKVVLTGNPRAQAVAGLTRNQRLADYGLNPEAPTLLIFGGSRGAPKMNQAAITAIPDLAAAGIQTLFVTGRRHFDALHEAHPTLPAGIVMVPYIDDMPSILPDISLIVGRSGATSLAELTALGIPSILIPSPNVTGNHQMINAKSLAKAGAAIVIPEADLTADFGHQVVALMQDPNRLTAMAQSAKHLGVPDAADQLISVLQAAIKESNHG